MAETEPYFREAGAGPGVVCVHANALPRAEVLAFEGLGHMGPVTHPDAVNEPIARFLERA